MNPYVVLTAVLVLLAATLRPPELRANSGVVLRTVLLGLGLAFLGVAGAKAFSAIERGSLVWHDLAWELGSGLRYPGGIIAVALGLPLLWSWAKLPVSFARYADGLVVGMALVMAIVRLRCFQRGCCHGTLTDLPWATHHLADTAAWFGHVGAGLIPESAEWSLYAHPLQIYFLFAVLGIAAFLFWLEPRKHYDGQVALAFLLLDGLSKGALESLRFAYNPPLQIAALSMATLGAAGLFAGWLRGKKTDGGRGEVRFT